MKHLINFNENKEYSGRYFFSRDSDSHWYMIPLELKDKWLEMTLNDIDWDDYDKQEEFERLFGEYRTGGGINFSFENPIKIK